MPAAKKPSPSPLPDLPFSLPVPFSSKRRAQRGSSEEATAAPASTGQNAASKQPTAVKPAEPKRKRLSKAFDRPLDKILRRKAVQAVIPPKATGKATVRESFTLSRIEHDRLIELKDQLNQQGTKVRKGELIRIGLILAMSISPDKLKSALGKLPPLK